MSPEDSIQSVMCQHISLLVLQGLHCCDESLASFDERISLAAPVWAKCLLPSPRRC